MLFKNLSLYWNTLIHLKFIQVYWRIFIKLRAPFLPRPEFTTVTRNQKQFKNVAFIEHNNKMYFRKRFFLINKSGSLSDVSWNGPKRNKLWRYNQHYFEWLNTSKGNLNLNDNIWLIKDWISHNVCPVGVGWEPYPLSLRIINWIKFRCRFKSICAEMDASIFEQTIWLSKNIEWHLLGNHLFKNAKALIVSGLYFSGNKADTFLKTGLNIVEREIDEQVLPDGANFELSPMYHAIFLEDILDLINFSMIFPDKISIDVTKKWQKISLKMLTWLGNMCHPDKQISFFNDSCLNVAPQPNKIFEYARSIGITRDIKDESEDVIQMRSSGYIRVCRENCFAILDLGQIGPSYLPGHAHADTLSFEASIFGERVFVNSGISLYDISKVRLEERGTSAHNTVEINGKNSSEVWSSFRVAKRAVCSNVKVSKKKGNLMVLGEHDGYNTKRNKLVHRRQWNFHENKLIINDFIDGTYATAKAFYHIHPKINVRKINPKMFELIVDNNRRILFKSELGAIKTKVGFYSSEFGKRVKNRILYIPIKEAASKAVISWA